VLQNIAASTAWEELLSRPWEELLSMLSSAAGVKEAAAALDVLLSFFGCCWTGLGVRHLAAHAVLVLELLLSST
jgi:hypothetical protein